MSFILGDTILPYPKSFNRDFIETSQENLLMGGKSTKRTENRKEKFTLVFQELTQDEANSILSEYKLEAVRTFQVTEANLSIGPTDVLVDINPRDYPLSAKAYRENLTLILTEVI